MQARLLAAAALSITAVVSAPVAAQWSTPAVDCATPRGLDQRRACEMARQGIEPLRRFAESRRHIYAIYLPAYLATAEEAERAQRRTDAAAPAKVAEVK